VALRPLGLGDVFDGAFTTVRRNPGAMVGLSAVVLAVAMLVPAVVALVMARAGALDADTALLDPDSGSGSGAFSLLSAVPYLGLLVGSVVTVVLNGLLVRVVSEAVLGRRTSAGEAWRRTRGQVPRLLALSLGAGFVGLLVLAAVVGAAVLVGLGAGTLTGVLVGVLLGLAWSVACVWLLVRFLLLAPAAMVLEGTGLRASLRRAGELSRGQFWRLLGISLLARLAAGLVAQVFGVALGVVAIGALFLVGGTTGGLVYVFAQLVSQVLTSAITTPFVSGVTALQYVDQRIRKEGLDVALIAAAGEPGDVRR